MRYTSSPSALDSLQTCRIIGTVVLILGSIKITRGSIVAFQILSRNSVGSLANEGKQGKLSSELIWDSTGRKALELIPCSSDFFFRRTSLFEKQRPNIPEILEFAPAQYKSMMWERSWLPAAAMRPFSRSKVCPAVYIWSLMFNVLFKPELISLQFLSMLCKRSRQFRVLTQWLFRRQIIFVLMPDNPARFLAAVRIFKLSDPKNLNQNGVVIPCREVPGSKQFHQFPDGGLLHSLAADEELMNAINAMVEFSIRHKGTSIPWRRWEAPTHGQTPMVDTGVSVSPWTLHRLGELV